MHRATRTARLVILPAILALSLAVTAACGDDGGEPEPNPGVPSGALRIDMDGLDFRPTELTVPAGETVYFTNSESALHTVDIDGEDLSGDMRRDAVFAHVFEQAGEYKITCKYHPQMKATITAE